MSRIIITTTYQPTLFLVVLDYHCCIVDQFHCNDGGRGDGDKHHDNVKVIHRTVVVHDRDNNPQTILLNANTQTGTCFVSSQEVVNVPDLVTQLLNQCTSITITP
jgi:hypothetical protein